MATQRTVLNIKYWRMNSSLEEALQCAVREQHFMAQSTDSVERWLRRCPSGGAASDGAGGSEGRAPLAAAADFVISSCTSTGIILVFSCFCAGAYMCHWMWCFCGVICVIGCGVVGCNQLLYCYMGFTTYLGWAEMVLKMSF